MAEDQSLVKVSLFITKRPDMTDEAFRKHWKGPHADIALKNKVFMDKVVKYNQVHVYPEMKEQCKEFGLPMYTHDGIAEVWVKSIEDWKTIASDPEFVEKILPDEKLFIQGPITIQLSKDNLVIKEH